MTFFNDGQKLVLYRELLTASKLQRPQGKSVRNETVGVI